MWTRMAQYWAEWRAFVNTVMDIPSPKRALNITRTVAEPLPTYLGLRTMQLQTVLLIHTWYPS